MKIFTFILTILLLTLLIALINYFLFDKKDKVRGLIDTAKIFLLVNTLNLSMFNTLYGFKNLINVTRADYIYFLYYFLNGLLIGLIYLSIRYLFNRLFIIEKRGIKKPISTSVMLVATFIVFFIGCLGFSGTRWEQEVYYNATPDQIFITMLTPITGTDSKIIFSFIEGPFMLSLSLSILLIIIALALIENKFTRGREVKHINEVMVRNITIILGFIILVSGLSFTFVGMQLDKIVTSYMVEDSFIEDNYVSPADVKLKSNGKTNNLIHIYLESIENSFFDLDKLGLMDDNLLPNLYNLYSEGDNFSHTSNSYGGPLKTYGGSFSVASMVNQFFGLPMRVPAVKGQYAKEGMFLPGAIGLGDILTSVGYETSFLHGAAAEFAGLNNFYSDHGGFKLFDYNYARMNGYIPKDYRVNWGFEDEKLYEFAKEEILRLNALGKPFYVIVENADTHNPGFAFDGDEPVFGDSELKEDYAKTIRFSEKHVYEFVKWIMAQDFYKDTTIVLIGDHNSMDGSLFKGRDKGYTRTTYNLILNSRCKGKNSSVFKNREWSNFDYFPTILASLGFEIEGNRLGLGTNLYSGEKTLFESLGYEECNRRLVCNSKFYNDSFMRKRRDYDGSNIVIS